jgi:imidazolonepropionase
VSDLNVVAAACVARVRDRGSARRGAEQGELDLVLDAAVAIRDGAIVAVGPSEALMREWGDPAVPVLDATGCAVLPGLIECHSHPLFAGERHLEYAKRLGGASLAEIAAAGGGIWASVLATRAASSEELLDGLRRAYERILAGGVTTLEVKSGYGLTLAEELRQLKLLDRSRSMTPMELVVSFLGAHVVPAGTDADAYVSEVLEMLPRALEQGCAFHDITCESGLFTPAQALSLFERSRTLGVPTRCHADAWASSEGWQTAVSGGAVSAEHLTYTPDEEIRSVRATDTIAVLLPQAELIYMTDRRAHARAFIDTGVPVAVATDYCSSIHATSLPVTLGIAAPWFRLTPSEVIVGGTLNAAYALGLAGDRGSIDSGKRGDLTILSVAHPGELCLAVGQEMVSDVIIGGEIVHSTRTGER